MKKQIKLQKFSSEDQERNFWSKLNLSKYLEASDLERVLFPNLKPTSRSISIRMPEYLIMLVKEKAHEINIPYQSLMKQYIASGVLGKR